jgi:hypothetical protein
VGYLRESNYPGFPEPGGNRRSKKLDHLRRHSGEFRSCDRANRTSNYSWNAKCGARFHPALPRLSEVHVGIIRGIKKMNSFMTFIKDNNIRYDQTFLTISFSIVLNLSCLQSTHKTHNGHRRSNESTRWGLCCPKSPARHLV